MSFDWFLIAAEKIEVEEKQHSETKITEITE